jgi:hypothetical protein
MSFIGSLAPYPAIYKGSGRGKPKEQILRSRLPVYPDSPLPLLTYELALHITEFSELDPETGTVG